ncbi:hypothetical protein Dimus_023098, partial [Dionaea muscipula]
PINRSTTAKNLQIQSVAIQPIVNTAALPAKQQRSGPAHQFSATSKFKTTAAASEKKKGAFSEEYTRSAQRQGETPAQREESKRSKSTSLRLAAAGLHQGK